MTRCWAFAVLVLLPVTAAFAPAGGDKDEKEIRIEEKLTIDDPKDKTTNSAFKLHPVNMKAGFVYTIDMVSKQLDSFLRLEDKSGIELAADDDGGGDLNARIIFSCPKDGEYKVICTALGNGFGDYVLTIKAKINVAKHTTAHQILLGKPAADFKGDFALNGKVVHLAELKGKVVLLDLSDLRSDACVAAISRLRDWNEKYKADGLEIVGLTFYNFEIGQKLAFDKDQGRFTKVEAANKNTDQAALGDFAAYHKLQHRLLVLTKEDAYKTFDAYAVNGVPQTVLIDRDGIVRFVWIGDEKSASGLEDEVKKLLAEGSTRRDWKKHPAIVEIDTESDVYAVGDIHGDYERLLTVLEAAKIIPADPGSPENIQWQAGKAVLVCPGDFINKWNQSLRVISLLRTLQKEAAKAGGRVVVTLGNHEAEFLANPVAKKTMDITKEMQAQGLKPQDVAAGTDRLGIGQWLRSLPAAARVNDWFFAHAGNTHGRTLGQLRDDLQKGIDKQGYAAPILQDPDSILQARMHPEPWWEGTGDTAAQSKEKLAKCLQALGVKHLVIGHQPGKIEFPDGTVRKVGELIQHFDGSIFLIDTGMSRGVGSSTGAVLRIHRGNNKVRAYRIPSSGDAVEIWSGPKAVEP